MTQGAGLMLAVGLSTVMSTAGAGPAAGEGFVGWVAVNDTIPEALTGQPGDAARGRALVADHRAGLCLLCHAAPLPGPQMQGTLAPPLHGVGARLSAAQLRLRVADQRLLNPETIMPAFHRPPRAERVGSAWQGRPVLTAQQVEDVVAWLQTLQ